MFSFHQKMCMVHTHSRRSIYGCYLVWHACDKKKKNQYKLFTRNNKILLRNEHRDFADYYLLWCSLHGKMAIMNITRARAFHSENLFFTNLPIATHCSLLTTRMSLIEIHKEL